jgi:hypothetical protein
MKTRSDLVIPAVGVRVCKEVHRFENIRMGFTKIPELGEFDVFLVDRRATITPPTRIHRWIKAFVECLEEVCWAPEYEHFWSVSVPPTYDFYCNLPPEETTRIPSDILPRVIAKILGRSLLPQGGWLAEFALVFQAIDLKRNDSENVNLSLSQLSFQCKVETLKSVFPMLRENQLLAGGDDWGFQLVAETDGQPYAVFPTTSWMSRMLRKRQPESGSGLDSRRLRKTRWREFKCFNALGTSDLCGFNGTNICRGLTHGKGYTIKMENISTTCRGYTLTGMEVQRTFVAAEQDNPLDLFTTNSERYRPSRAKKSRRRSMSLLERHPERLQVFMEALLALRSHTWPFRIEVTAVPGGPLSVLVRGSFQLLRHSLGIACIPRLCHYEPLLAPVQQHGHPKRRSPSQPEPQPGTISFLGGD